MSSTHGGMILAGGKNTITRSKKPPRCHSVYHKFHMT